MSASGEKVPVHESLKVLDSITISKSSGWWSAVVLVENYGRKNISIYLWRNQEGAWKRVHKFEVNRKNEWEKIKAAVDSFFQRMEAGTGAGRGAATPPPTGQPEIQE